MHGVSTRKVDDLVEALGRGLGDLQVRGQPDLCRARQGDGGLPDPPSRPRRLPLPVLRRHLREGSRPRPGRVAEPSSSSTGVTARRQPRGARLSTSGTPRTGCSGRRSCAAFASGGFGRSPRRLRPPPRAERGDREGLHRCRPGSAAGCTSCATRWLGCPKAEDPDGRRRDPDDLRPARRGPTSHRQLDEVADTLRLRLRRGGEAARGGEGGPVGLLDLPDRPLAEDLVDEPLGARERRDQATHQRRRHLPERRLGAAPRDRRARRAARRVGGRRNGVTSPRSRWHSSTNPSPTSSEEKGVSLAITA